MPFWSTSVQKALSLASTNRSKVSMALDCATSSFSYLLKATGPPPNSCAAWA